MPYADAAKVTPLGCHWPMKQWGEVTKVTWSKYVFTVVTNYYLNFSSIAGVHTAHVFQCVKKCVVTYVNYTVSLLILSSLSTGVIFYRLLWRHYYVITSHVILILNAANFHIQYPVLHKATNMEGRNEGLIKREK